MRLSSQNVNKSVRLLSQNWCQHLADGQKYEPIFSPLVLGTGPEPGILKYLSRLAARTL